MKVSPARRGSTRLAVKAGTWYAVSSFLGKGMAFLTTPVFARMMSAEAYGEFSSFASWMATLLIVTGAELHTTISRAYYDYTEDFDAYVSTVMMTGCVLTAAVYVLFLLCGEWLTSLMALRKECIHILFAALLFQSCKHCFLARERTLYRYKMVAGVTLLNLLIPTAAAVVLVLLSPEDGKLHARIYGYYIPSAAIGLMCACVILHRGRRFKTACCRYAFKLSLPLTAQHLTAYLLTSSNTIVAKSVLGAASTAVVSIASSTIHILTIFFQALSGSVTTWLMDNLKQEQYQKLRRDLLIYAAGLAAVSITVILLAPEVVWILGGAKYMESVWLIPGQVTAVLIQSVTSVFTIILTYDRNVAQTAAYTGGVAVLSIAAKVLLLKQFGVQALPYVNMAAFASLYVINYLLVRKAGYAKVVNFRMITVVLMVVGAVMLASNSLYQHGAIRYSLIAVLAIAGTAVLWRYRKPGAGLIQKKTN